MNAPNDNNTAASRSGMRRLISPWAFNHLRTVAGIRFATGLLLTVIGSLMLARGADWAAALLLAIAAVHFSWGYWQLTIARSAHPHLSGR
jgi:hypothetical protein